VGRYFIMLGFDQVEDNVRRETVLTLCK
jgi:hypothetical protein